MEGPFFSCSTKSRKVSKPKVFHNKNFIRGFYFSEHALHVRQKFEGQLRYMESADPLQKTYEPHSAMSGCDPKLHQEDFEARTG